MRFWDSSALVPLLIPEKDSAFCRDCLDEDPEMIVWGLSVTEIWSAIHRRQREKQLPVSLTTLRDNLALFEEVWSEIVKIVPVRQKAARLLAVHSLRAADALQLAAALVAFQDKPEGEIFVTLDQNLALAARREGFKVLP